MHSFRQRNGSRKVSQPNLNSSRRRTKRSQSLPTLLLKKCSEHPKAATAGFATTLLLWLGLMAFVSFRLPSDKHANAALSRLSSREEDQARQTRALSHIRSTTADKPPPSAVARRRKKPRAHPKDPKNDELKKELRRHNARDGITAMLLSKVLPPDPEHPHDPVSLLSSLKERREEKMPLNKPKKMESKRQSTRDALDYSEPYAQENGDVDPPANSIYAFAAEDYLDRRTMMGDDEDDTLDYYYSIDDDNIRGNRTAEKYEGHEDFCTTPSFYRLYQPTCNEVHAAVGGPQWLTGDEYLPPRRRSRYLGAGAYRQVFRLERPFAFDSDEVIFKSMKRLPPDDGTRTRPRTLEERAAYRPDEVYKNFELYDDMRKDSMVMELLTSSPRIADIYSFCALSSLIEYVPGTLEHYVMPTDGEQEEDTDDPTPVNDHIKPLEKLEMALELAKGLAAMHGHSGGVIANVDVQIGQFCRGKDGLIKILDFNRAEVLMWDEKKDRYCTFNNGVPPDGSLRAPEEIIDAALTEKIDVYTLGNVIYSVLTGLLVNQKYDTQRAHRRITHGKTEHIDVEYFASRSPAEMALVQVIQWCWTFDAEERPSIFQVVEYLEEEVRKNVYSSEDVY